VPGRRWRFAFLFIIEDRHGVGFVCEQIGKQDFPTHRQVTYIWRDRSAVKHVPQIDDRDRQHDHQSRNGLPDQLCGNELG
jgi:hypothetical protein